MNSINQGIEEEEKICSGTVRSTALKDGLIASRPVFKPFLTEEHIKLRLDFAERFQNKTSHFWMNVIFMDESYLRLACDDSRLRVRRRQGESLQKENIVASFKHGGGGVMFWGCVSWYGVGPLVPIEGTIGGETYGEILARYIPQVTPHLLTTSPYIIEDGSKVHKTKYVLAIKESLNLRSLDLPPNSPDLNVIENIWALWKDKVRRRKPSNEAELRAIGLEEWQNITQEEVRTYIRSMPDRIEAVLSSKGMHTKY